MGRSDFDLLSFMEDEDNKTAALIQPDDFLTVTENVGIKKKRSPT